MSEFQTPEELMAQEEQNREDLDVPPIKPPKAKKRRSFGGRPRKRISVELVPDEPMIEVEREEVNYVEEAPEEEEYEEEQPEPQQVQPIQPVQPAPVRQPRRVAFTNKIPPRRQPEPLRRPKPAPMPQPLPRRPMMQPQYREEPQPIQEEEDIQYTIAKIQLSATWLNTIFLFMLMLGMGAIFVLLAIEDFLIQLLSVLGWMLFLGIGYGIIHKKLSPGRIL